MHPSEISSFSSNPSKTPARSLLLKNLLASRVLVLDGAMGTAIQNRNLSAQDFGGDSFEGCNEYLCVTRPDVVREIHEEYLRSGCDIIETNTFGGTAMVLDEYELGSQAREINLAAARIAREIADQYSSPEQPRFVAGSIGPTTKALSVTGGATFEQLIREFRDQAIALIEGKVDYLLLETCQDTRNIKAGLLGIEEAYQHTGVHLPIAISGTIEPMGTMLAGQGVEALYASVEHVDLLYIGLNCATGPEFMTDHIRTLAQISRFPVACVPNAGLPDENGKYLESPEMLTATVSRFVEKGWINLLGGCCGTQHDHIAHLCRMAKKQSPRETQAPSRSLLSGVDALEVTDELRPVLVGERTNVIGSKKFKTLICEEKYDEASEIARLQVKNGAQIVDICLANPDRDEFEDMKRFLDQATKKVRAPLMIDSTDEKVIELALTYSQGKAIINSVNLEDGEERFEKVVPLARRYGAALVVGTIDDHPEQGMAVSRDRKLAVARRSYDLLTQKYGMKAEDIYFDPLVFPCATGDQQYIGSAVETIEGVKLIKAHFPKCKTVLGISNVSFGLPAAGREVLNSVFLYHCVQAGLDLAIVNSEKLERYSSIPPEEVELANRLLWNQGEDPIAAFAAHFRTKAPKEATPKQQLPLHERLSRCIIEGSKDGLQDDLNEALQNMRPLEIINGPLMKGMDEVGRLFNSNQLIVAEVLQSAEVMKSAVAQLEPHMERSESNNRGKVILATVKGDVHDIGKNLVEIILSNNGFEVVNLGIKVLPETLIQAVREHRPDLIGLSGLLVKSAQQMVLTADDFSKAGVLTPMLVGGAALSENFVDRQIAPAYLGTVAYASDAMAGLDLAKQIVDPSRFEELKKKLHEKREAKKAAASLEGGKVAGAPVESHTRSSSVIVLEQVPSAPDFERHVLKTTPLETIWRYINPLMLYGRHLGIKGGVVRQLEQARNQPALQRELQRTEPKAFEIDQLVEEIKKDYRDSEVLRPQAVYQFFQASSEGNQIHLGNRTFQFPRQLKEEGLCLADYVLPQGHTLTDSVALFVVTVGKGVREKSEALKNSGDYLRSHILQVLALETAEAYAEYLHSQIRRQWGFGDLPEMTMMERFQAKYRGKRYSFGYPACPRLEDQRTLFDLLRPEELGVELTDGFMMDPEASVSAMVFHHPGATYFSVGTRALDASEANRQ